MTFPALNATLSALNADNPCANTSALTNSVMQSVFGSSTGADVDFPAPFGPAKTTTIGSAGLLYLVVIKRRLPNESSPKLGSSDKLLTPAHQILLMPCPLIPPGLGL